MHTLKMEKLSVMVGTKVVLDDFNLEIKSGEVHALMGPNGTGKSTLSKVIMGDETYKIVSGDITFDGKSILNMTTDERSRLGIFLAMQSPIAIEGVSNADFLRTACATRDGDAFKLFPFIKELEANAEKLKIDTSFIHRGVNVGFSGGERKKNEVLQMYMLKPKMVLLDEIDSGLDVDSLKIVGTNIMDYKKQAKCGLLVITHYERLLDYIRPDFVHIMVNGHIVKSGDQSLVKYIEDNGYDAFIDKKDDLTSTCIVRDILDNE